MPEISPRLSLSYVLPQQAQKHVTVNETVRRLDALVQLAVVSRSLAAEPTAPAEGDAYILPAGRSGGAWSAMAVGAIAAWQDGAWVEIAPRLGWRAYAAAESRLLVYNGSAWTEVVGAAETAARFGVNTAADTTNRLAVKANAALFSHDDVTPGSGDHRLVVNKSAAARTGAVVLQTGFSGRAELGLAGDDDFRVKVSAEGAVWHEALVVSRTTGVVSTPLTPRREVLAADRTYFVRTDGNDANTGLVDSAAGAFLTIQKAVDVVAALDVGIFTATIQVRSGTYAGQVVLKRPVGSGVPVLLGDTTTPANVVITATNAHAIDNVAGGVWELRGFRLTTTTFGHCIRVQGAGNRVSFRNIDFGAAAGGGAHMQPFLGGAIEITGAYAISGGANAHYQALQMGVVRADAASYTCTITGTPAFAQAFAVAANNSYVQASSAITFSGAATGSRYAASLNGVINTATGNVNFLPGNSAGSTATGGQYA
ncbi:MAG: DUF2793 domain-containing protein [Parvularculaceae bacterium]|nr:DUF2793 domain-containing protein [Parvularculaceae bacterium]